MPSVDSGGSAASVAGGAMHMSTYSAAAPEIIQPGLAPLKLDLEWTDFPRRVLLVEPNKSDSLRLRNELVTGQMEVFTATDVFSAAHALSIFNPNVILAHMRLPTYNGMELVFRVKQDRATCFTPVILYSNYATLEERVMALDCGAVDLLVEPFAVAELVARVRGALKARHRLSVLERTAHLDDLTGLANRRVLDDHLRREWNACRRRGVPLSVIIVDLDHFKAINDTHGHPAGDDVLCHAAKVLSQSVRSSDFVARYGGEEFVVVAPDCQLSAAAALAERFRSSLAAQPVCRNGREIAVTASAGVAATDAAGDAPAELLCRADKALYQAKRSGRDATWAFDPAQPGAVVSFGAERCSSSA
jgi:diguanylate cyclase (GGDEF)-like protein